MSGRELERMGTERNGAERSAGANVRAAGRSSDAKTAEDKNHQEKKGCDTCWHCQPGTPFKGYCMKWGISVSYSETCKMHKEASPRRKKEIAQMQTWFEDHGYVEVKLEVN